MVPSSDTAWLLSLKQGHQDAARILWDRYARLLLDGARKRLAHLPRRAADEEDVALSAFASFCRGVEKGRFPKLDDRDDLRVVLLLLVARKAAHLIRLEQRQKRGGGAVRAFSELQPDSSDDAVLAALVDAEPTPASAVCMTEDVERLLGLLSEELRGLALLRLEGYTNAEIAARYQCTERTVERKLREVRDRWHSGTGHDR